LAAAEDAEGADSTTEGDRKAADKDADLSAHVKAEVAAEPDCKDAEARAAATADCCPAHYSLWLRI
jgi:hypothetical protein